MMIHFVFGLMICILYASRPGYGLEMPHGVTSSYVRGPPSPTLPMESPLLVLSLAASNSPEQVHLALAEAGGMTVSWVTPDPDTQVDSVVWYREVSSPHPSSDEHSAQSALHSPSTFTSFSSSATSTSAVPEGLPSFLRAVGRSSSYSCSSAACPANYTSGRLHHAVLRALKPDTRYHYKMHGWDGAEFLTPPVAGPQVEFTYTLLGDLGQTNNSVKTMEHIQTSGGGLVILVGDLSYADGFQPRWDSFGRLFQPMASTRPVMTIEGNHEKEWAIEGSLLDQLRAYNARYHMPPLTGKSPPADLADGGPNNCFYSFVHGSVLWIMMGAYVDFSEGSPQQVWLRATLASIDREATPWVFATTHAPWYSSNSWHQGEYEGAGMRKQLEHLLLGAPVDALVTGHVHAYERTVAVAEGRVVEECACSNQTGSAGRGLVHLCVGDGGNREGLAGIWQDPQPAWSAFRESSYGHATLKVFNSTHALWRWHRNQDGEVVVADEFMFTKTSNCKCNEHEKSLTLTLSNSKSLPRALLKSIV